MPNAMARYLARLCILALVAPGAVMTAPMLQHTGLLPGHPLVLADDDDGGDDGGDDGDDGGDDDDGGGGSYGGGGGGGGSDNDRPRGDLRQLFRWPFRQAERPAPRRQQQVRVPDRAPNEIVAVGLTEQSITNLVQDGFQVDQRTPIAMSGSELVRLIIPQGMTLDAARQAVATEAPAAAVDFNHFYQPEQDESSACGDKGCSLIRHIVGWPMEVGKAAPLSCTTPQPIGLIDTAINAEHGSLADAQIEVLRLGDEKAPASTKQHGTAVAALLVGAPSSRAPGLIPSARMVAVDAFQQYRKTADIANVYDLVRAIDMLVARDIKVINLSLSGPHNLLLEQGVRAAIDKGTILIAAAGNEGPNAKPVYPAAYPRVIAVTAVDKSMKPYRRAVRGEHIDIAAPGVGVWTAASISGGRQKSGTSFAAPFVTAAVSVLLGANPNLKPEEIEEKLMQSAEDMGEPGKDKIFGWGLLNVRTLCES